MSISSLCTILIMLALVGGCAGTGAQETKSLGARESSSVADNETNKNEGISTTAAVRVDVGNTSSTEAIVLLIADEFLEHEGTKLRRIEVYPVENSKSEWVAICDSDPRWWGKWCVFRVEVGAISWIHWGNQVGAMCTHIKGFHDKNFIGILVEVWTVSHGGNGHFNLVEVEHDAGLGIERLLVSVNAVGRWREMCYLFGNKGDGHSDNSLDVKYEDMNSDGRFDVTLNGYAHFDDHYIESTGMITGDRDEIVDIRMTFVWNDELHEYVIDPTRSSPEPE